MAKTILYDATLMTEQGARALQVDIFDLPYDEFDAVNPLLIAGNVVLGSPKNKVFPDFRNVEVDGLFDCSHYKILPNTVLPRGIISLVCKCSINNLSDLIGVLPDSVQTVVLKSSMLNAVGRDSDAYNAAIKFTEHYPNIVVTDGKQTLFTVLQSVEQKRQKSVQPIEEVRADVVVVPMKTEEYLSRDELAIACIVHMPVLSQMSMDVLARYIKMAFSARSGLRLNVQEMKRLEDGVKITCVHRGDVDAIAKFVADKDAEQRARVIAQTNVVENKSKQAAPVAPVQKAAKKTFNIDGREAVQTGIKKYIPNRLWNQIRGAAGNNKVQLLAILNDIECINVWPADTKGERVYYIADGELKVSRMVEFKNSRCMAQGFSGQNNRPRIIWGMADGVFVCVNFFAEHCSNTASLKYKKFIREFKMDLSDINLDEYLSVSDLIAEMSDPHGKPVLDGDEEIAQETDSVSNAEPVSESVVVPETQTVSENAVVEPAVVAETVAEPASAVVAPVATKSVARRPRLHHVRTEKIEPQKHPLHTANVTKTARDNSESSAPEWVELYSLSAQIKQKQEWALSRKNELLAQLTTESDADKALEINERLRQALLQQKRFEDALKRILSINRLLCRIRSDFEKEQ